MFEIIHPDGDTYNDEYVDIINSGSSDGDLLGYTVEDGAGSTYSFPNGYSLAAGETVRLHSGDGTNTNTDIDEHSAGKSHFRDLMYESLNKRQERFRVARICGVESITTRRTYVRLLKQLR